MTSFSAIPQTKLNVLLEAVCRSFDYLSTQINSATPLWDEPIKMCEKIESDPFEVYNILPEVRKRNSPISGNNTPRQYQTILCRVYILLYYRGRNNPRYQEIVFPRLKENMGVYGRTYFDSINERIDNILKQEEMLEKLLTEEKKYVKPVFAYVAHNRNEMDHLYIEYGEEKLFREMKDIIKYLTDMYHTRQDEANVWYNAKEIVHTLRDVNRPELLIERAATALVAGQLYSGYEGSQIILICAYAMIRSAKENTHFAPFIKEMESLADADTDLIVIKNSIKGIKDIINEKHPFDDYDYIGEQTSNSESYTSADVERIRNQIVEHEKVEREKLLKKIEYLESSEKTLKQQVSSLEKELEAERAKKKSDSTEKEQDVEMLTELESTPILQMLWYLMKLDGASVEGHGKKKLAQNIMSTLSKIPFDTTKKFWKKEDDPLTRQEELIVNMNHWMKAIGMKFQF